MRTLRAIIVVIVTLLLIYILDTGVAGIPPLGRLLDPVNGCWANAEPVYKDFSEQLVFPKLKNNALMWLDSRMVPHIHAGSDEDLYFIQGYIHATYRLWQMDMQTRAAAGRLSEIIGSKTLKYDRAQRRKGMIYAAENSLRVMEANPQTKQMLDAYTGGVNAYIASLRYRDYPFEYKLLGFKPELWTNLKCALLLKYMADDLTGYTEDIPLTFLRDMLPADEFNQLFPEKIAGSKPLIPAGTPFSPPSLSAPPQPDDSVWAHFPAVPPAAHNDEGIGSNNWVLSGSRTKSGAPILCNDPHLGINLPSLWYEVQLQAPGINVYGVSLPGAPGVVIGFNENITWGFTNNYRDVKDFYEVKQVAGKPSYYWFAGRQLQYAERIEHIKIKGAPELADTVRYTIQGPVMYDANFHEDGINKPLAMCWMAHRATSELLSIYQLNRANNYAQFTDAIMNFQCPAQNMAYADRQGNIALWGQGQFVNKWKEQGRFVMNGADSAALWGKLIPMSENPHALNPAQGYLCSANQSVTDSAYPYWYNGYFYEFRAWRINQVLSAAHSATIQDMVALQQDTYSILAANTLPVMLAGLPGALPPAEAKYIHELKRWDYRLSPESHAATIYQVWWSVLYNALWQRKFGGVPEGLLPSPERTMQLMQNAEINKYCEQSGEASPLSNAIAASLKQATDSLHKLENTAGLEWYKVKNTSVKHLLKLPAFSVEHLKIGGWNNVVNAAKTDHGPSWRMVVQMGANIDAYAIYPGGQSGNPGSKYYSNFVHDWAAGIYYKLLFFPNTATQDNKQVKYTVSFEKGN